MFDGKGNGRVQAQSLPLRLRDLRFERGGQRLLDIPALSIAPGEPTLIMGPNGAGKSVLLRLLHGLEAPTSGQVLAGDAPLDEATRRRQAMVFQRPVILRRSVRANLAFALHGRRMSRAEKADRIDALLRMARLSDRAAQSGRSLSGGEQQRLALVRALATEPDVLFLDEPTASLDPGATQAIETLIREASATGTKIVMVTHDPGQARRLGGEVLFLNKGHLVEQTAVEPFLDTPATDAARRFLRGDLLV
ncbi:MAG: ATP-binding cassette domain-containing protein [Rhodobacteraceae bacterium]|nr:ATP-binding cassette domain-containing protein [Paracoccaceae bacterium]